MVGTKYCQNCGEPLALLRNRYQPIEFLGEGGFGRTFIAEDKDRLGALCVVKQLVPKLPASMTANEAKQAFQTAQNLFKREAEQLEKLEGHPQIPALFAYFETDGFFYLVQQFIDSEPLEQVCKGQWTEKQVSDFLSNILPVLDYIHQQGVIHRDIKPPNILRRKDDGQYVLIDFGAAKVSLTAQQGTWLSLFIGTQGYAAYEQIDRNNPTQKVYPATDLYSLGVTCFYLLTGKEPDYLVQNDGYNWVKHWRNYLPQKLSPELDQILDKLLRKNHHERYQSAGDVIQALDAAMSNPLVKSPVIPVKPTQQSQKSKIRAASTIPVRAGNQPTIKSPPASSKLPIMSKVLGLVVVALLGILGINAIISHSEARQLEARQLYEALKQQGDNLRESGEYEEAIASYSQALEINPNSHAAWYGRGYALEKLERYEEAITIYDQALQIKPDSHEVWREKGFSLTQLERYEEAIYSFDKALQIKPDDHEVWREAGFSLTRLGQHEEAITIYEKVLQSKPDDHEVWHAKGFSLDDLRRYEEAIHSFDTAIEIEPDYDKAWGAKGHTLGRLGRYKEALSCYDKAIELNPNKSLYWYNRGVQLGNLGRQEEALVSYDKAIQIKPDDHDSWNNRGAALVKLGRHEEALASYDKALQIKPDLRLTQRNRNNLLRQLRKR